MPPQGYLQDLYWLTGERDCLLSLADSPTRLTENSHLESKNNEYQDLSESTLQAMMLLNTDFDKADKAENLSLFPATPSISTSITSPCDMLPPVPSRQSIDGKGLSNMESPTQPSSQPTPLGTDSITQSQERSPVPPQAAALPVQDLEEAQGEQTDSGSLFPAAASPPANRFRHPSRVSGEDERREVHHLSQVHPADTVCSATRVHY